MNSLGGFIALLSGTQIVFTFSDEGIRLYRLLTSPSAPIDWWRCLGQSEHAPLFCLVALMLLVICFLAWHQDGPSGHGKKYFHRHAHK